MKQGNFMIQSNKTASFVLQIVKIVTIQTGVISVMRGTSGKVKCPLVNCVILLARNARVLVIKTVLFVKISSSIILMQVVFVILQ